MDRPVAADGVVCGVLGIGSLTAAGIRAVCPGDLCWSVGMPLCRLVEGRRILGKFCLDGAGCRWMFPEWCLPAGNGIRRFIAQGLHGPDETVGDEALSGRTRGLAADGGLTMLIFDMACSSGGAGYCVDSARRGLVR